MSRISHREARRSPLRGPLLAPLRLGYALWARRRPSWSWASARCCCWCCCRACAAPPRRRAQPRARLPAARRHAAHGASARSVSRRASASWCATTRATSTGSCSRRRCRRASPSSSSARWPRCPSPGRCCGAWARSSSSASTGTRARPMRAACCAMPPGATRWCSSPRAPSPRTPGLLKFHAGAFVTAARAGCPLVPAVVRGTRRALPPGRRAAAARAASSSRSCRRSRRRAGRRTRRAVPELRERRARGDPGRARRAATSHVATILPAHLIQRVRDLPQRADLDALHELGEHVAAAGGRLLQARERRRSALALRAWKARTAATCACFSSSVERISCGCPCAPRRHPLRTGRC